MKAKYKMTGCARFLIFLIILAPIAYFGSKYLRDSGTWDKIKDKVEETDRSGTTDTREDLPSGTIESEVGGDISRQYEKLRTEYEAQQAIIAKQEQTIKNLQTENDALRKRLNEPASASIPPATTTTKPSNSDVSGTTPSLEELLREADSNLGNTSASGTPGSAGARTTLGEWDFTYSGATGVIEFFRQNNQLFSRITIQGDNRLNIEELEKRGNRIYVKNSPTGEYYVLLSNGNLEAYDQNGFQTTCIRKN